LSQNIISLSLQKIQWRRRHGLCKKISEKIKGESAPNLEKKKKRSETRGKNGQVSEVELGVQRYPPEWKKMDKCPTVELGVCYYPPKIRREKKRRKDSPCSLEARIKRRRNINMRSNER